MKAWRQFIRQHSVCAKAVSSDAGGRGACSQDFAVAEFPPPDRNQPALETQRSLLSCPRMPIPQPAERYSGKSAQPRWRARAWPTDGNCRRPPVHGHSLARAKPSLPASDGCRGEINRVRCQSPIGFGPVSSERAIMEVRMRRRYSFTSSGRLRAVPAASTSIMAMNTSREAEGL